MFNGIIDFIIMMFQVFGLLTLAAICLALYGFFIMGIGFGIYRFAKFLKKKLQKMGS